MSEDKRDKVGAKAVRKALVHGAPKVRRLKRGGTRKRRPR